MMLLIFTAVLDSKVESWYGPAEVSFELPVQGSPFDGAANSVDVKFISGTYATTRMAYYDGKGWRARLLDKKPGTYKAEVYKNGQRIKALHGEVRLVESKAQPFVRLDLGTNRFYTADGKPYWPVGHNLGWQSQNFMPMAEQLGLMGSAGLNWTRIWSCHWDGKNPYWVEGKPHPNGRDMVPEALDRWDALMAAATKAGVPFQFVLFHHGLVSSNVNSNWDQHPWNAKNGGFLEKPEHFFTDPEAIRRSKNWLRYAVARWGHEPAVMAWELFNEVEWVDAVRSNPASVGKWHDDMAAYIRSVDPYRHLITSSSGMELPIWKSMDFYQPHGYPPSVRAMVMGMPPSKDKPLFYGEVGTGEASPDGENAVIREALWSGLMAGHAGAAQYWWWDRLKPGDYADFQRFTSFVNKHKLAEGPAFAPYALQIDSRRAGAVRFAPGRGWASTERYEFQMPEDAASGALGKLSGFIQGPGKKEMMAEPIRFVFESPTPGRFEMRVSGVARAGASIELRLDGETKVEEKILAGASDIQLNKTFGIDFPAGKHVVTVSNGGPDWYVASWFRIEGIGQAVAGSASISGNRMILWLSRSSDQAEEFALKNVPQGWSRARVQELDLDSGATSSRSIELSDRHRLAHKNAVWLLEKS